MSEASNAPEDKPPTSKEGSTPLGPDGASNPESAPSPAEGSEHIPSSENLQEPINIQVPSSIEPQASQADAPANQPVPSSSQPSQRDAATGSTSFGPDDNRELYEWESKYPPKAHKEIDKEKWYLFLLLYSIPIAMTLVWSKWIWGNLGLGEAKYQVLARFTYAWLGGMFGGALFDLKWLYHSVAKGRWHLDRRLWRLFTPHISGALAFAFILLIYSNIFKLFDQATFQSSVPVVAVSFLVGYFSDSAIAKLTELTETLFGTCRKKEETPSPPPAADNSPRNPTS